MPFWTTSTSRDGSNKERLEVLEALKHFPQRLEAELVGVPEAALRVRPGDDEWCIKEVLGHVLYAEGICTSASTRSGACTTRC